MICLGFPSNISKDDYYQVRARNHRCDMAGRPTVVAAVEYWIIREEAPGAQFSEPLIFHLRLVESVYKHNLQYHI